MKCVCLFHWSERENISHPRCRNSNCVCGCCFIYSYCSFLRSVSTEQVHAEAACLWSLQASEDSFNRNRKQFITQVMTPLIQPHESSMAHPSETQESSGLINKVWKDIGGSRASRPISGRVHICMSVYVKGAHLSSNSCVTLLHTAQRDYVPDCICIQYSAASTGGNYCMGCYSTNISFS